MEELFWLRHGSLQQQIGPYSKDQLRSAIVAGAFPADSEVRREDGEEWQAVTVVLGMPAPPPSPSPSPAANPPANSTAAASITAFERVRAATAYSTFRTLVVITALVAIVSTLVVMVYTLSQAGRMMSGEMVLATLGSTAWSILYIVVGAMALQILADIADCALRRDAKA